MPRFPRLVRLLGLAGVAVWLGSPPSLVRAQVEKSRPGARRTEKAPAEDKGPPRISLLRLQVIKPEPAAPDARPGFPRRNRFGFEAAPREGTSLTFTLDEPQQWILGLEAKDCKITRFRDDKGTDLAVTEVDPAGGQMALDPRRGQEEGPISTEVDPAGHRATITVHSPRLPAGGEPAPPRGRPGREVWPRREDHRAEERGPESGQGHGGPDPPGRHEPGRSRPGHGAEKRHAGDPIPSGSPAEIKKVAFIGPDGEEIPTRGGGWGQSGSVHNTSYSLARKVETCTVRLTVPETVETVHMAVAINTGIGFPPFVSRRILPAPEPRPAVTGAAPR